jgi:hypothetical protein
MNCEGYLMAFIGRSKTAWPDSIDNFEELLEGHAQTVEATLAEKKRIVVENLVRHLHQGQRSMRQWLLGKDRCPQWTAKSACDYLSTSSAVPGAYMLVIYLTDSFHRISPVVRSYIEAKHGLSRPKLGNADFTGIFGIIAPIRAR